MNRLQIKDRKQSKDRLLSSLLALLFIAVVAVTVVMFRAALRFDKSCNWVGGDLHSIAIEGEYSEEGGEWLPLTRAVQFDYVELRDITVRGNFTCDLPHGEKLYIKIEQLFAIMKINGQEVLRVKPVPGDGNPTDALGNLWYTYVSPGITTADTVELRFGNLYKNAYFIQFDELLWGMRTGNERVLLFEAIAEDGGLWVIGSVFLLLTLFLLLVSLLCGVLRLSGVLSFLWLALTALFSACWFCTLAPSLSLISPFPVSLNILYAYSIQGIAAAVTLFASCNVTGGRRRALLWCVSALLALLLADMALQIAGIRDLFFAITSFSLLDITVAVCILFCLWREKSKGKNPAQSSKSLRAMLPLAAFGVLELVNGYVQFSEAAICFGLGLICFVVMESFYMLQWIKTNMESEKRALVLENELNQNRITIMLSQIQPHFLYNSLTAIKSLCTSDPPKAKEAVVSFASYLRGNLDALSTEKPILFLQELKHIETYLALEKMRFGEELRVVYDIACRDFALPVLTVQPLVENAVRYGITKKDDGGTISISTAETETEIIITVTDDGVGFDPAQENNDGKLHIGIENVRSRLKAQCGGSLLVKSMVGIGTTATITIPKGGKEDEYYCGG